MHKFRITITGIVQGVGFRPFIYNLAKRLDLNGWVGNEDSNVIIEIDSTEEEVQAFIDKIKSESPILSHINDIQTEKFKSEGFSDFVIKESRKNYTGNVYISPDVCICKDCISELKDPADRRYRYPFINCTNCGPRFSTRS
jgi:hydrogenase maturation protein HypF